MVTERSNILTAVIQHARGQALDSGDVHSVWAMLVRMANQSAPPAPLLGHSSDGIQYAGREFEEVGIPDTLSKKMFIGRFRRLLAKAR